MGKSLEGVLIKPAHKKQAFTEEEIAEYIKCADPISGPEYFMSHYFFIQHPTKGSISYQPFEYQKRLIETYHKYRYSISMLPRQTGKCVCADTMIKISNKNTGEEIEISIGDFYRMQENSTIKKQGLK